MKVLVSAYSCEPGKGSEPGVGWQLGSGLARYHDVWLITRANNRTAIEEELKRSPLPRLHVEYHDLPDRFLRWKNLPGGTRLYYSLWQRSILDLARRLHAQVGFDLVHHLTFAQYWSPIHLADLGPPLVWGPVGGGESASLRFLATVSAGDAVRDVARLLVQRLFELSPSLRRTARSSKLALATTAETAARLRRLGAPDVRLASNVGYESSPSPDSSSAELPFGLEDESAEGERGGDGPFRVLSMGRLLYWKGFHLGLEAFARSELGHAEYWIVGDGPERCRLERLARRLGIGARVRFLGNLPHALALNALRSSDVLVHPSYHDSGGFVCLEAMANARPVVCLALGGPAVHVDSASGFLIPAENRPAAVEGISLALESLSGDVGLRRKLGCEGQKRVRERYAWPQKVLELDRLYEEAVR